ncbi:L-threonine aldolase [Longilinea arvoryzae]|uniref:L-threonine aldolase n=1 Tax=Longilinea arvoryzae TaxID=360412 RepID=A0A0S7BBH7_9CHLR|nr:low-specificity L-threonine aldolase [Longilinea arvoryzae]GAP15148.1 L-threonine aldolase [Longilinea arvoryzae]
MASWIDLRSDTVTLPTPEMRASMAAAEVGDDVYGEDPTINRLQEMAAAKMGKEAGLFVTSGTMGNLIAVLAQCERGDEAIMGTLGHTFLFEAGGISALGGVFPHTLTNQADGTLLLEDIRSAIRPDDIHHPINKMVILENTQNRCGGVPLSVEYTRSVGEFAHSKGLLLHIDGARIFNAAAALQVTPAELAAPADTVTFCLSKGLCAPVGSVLCGSPAVIQRARRIRKQLGGGMRQAGILAAAGIYALEHMTRRLVEDHQHARRLAEGLAGIPGIAFEMGQPTTNMVFPSLKNEAPFTAAEVAGRLKEKGIQVGVVSERGLRMVTHYWIDDMAVEKTIQAFHEIL